MADKDQPAAEPVTDDVRPDAPPVKVEHGRTAVVTEPHGLVEWLPQGKAKKRTDDGSARRATERDLRVAGAPLSPPDEPQAGA